MAELRELSTDDEWDRAVPILRQLWGHREAAFVRSWREEDDYRLFGWFTTGADDPDGDLVAVAGVSIQRVLHHERHCWVHDFVVDEPERGEGHGAALLERLEGWARERGCEHLALGCVADNDEAFAFYESQGLEEWGSILETEL